MIDGYTTTMLPKVFTQRKFVGDFITYKMSLFYSQSGKFAFLATYWEPGGNERASYARWKSHGRLPICDNWTFFASS